MSLNVPRLTPTFSAGLQEHLVVAGHDGALRHEVVDRLAHARVRRQEERRPPERLVPRHAQRGIRPDRAVHAQLGPGERHVERQVARRDRHTETVARRVLKIQPEHQERRRVRLLPAPDEQSSLPVLVHHEAPLDRLVTVQARELQEVRFELADDQWAPDVIAEQGGHPLLVHLGDSLELQVRRLGKRRLPPAAPLPATPGTRPR